MGKYNLKIWGDLGPDANRAPGQLQPNSALQFALYTPQAYTPIASGEFCSINFLFAFCVSFFLKRESQGSVLDFCCMLFLDERFILSLYLTLFFSAPPSTPSHTVN
jgi:hypothetical protein